MSLPPDARPPARDESTSDETVVEGLDDLLRPRLSQRAQQLRAGLLVALVVVVASGLIWRSGGLSLLVPSAPPSTPTATSPLVRITSNISFGTVSVNGRNLGALPATARMYPGSNVVTLNAPPFKPHTCIITWPGPGSNDLTCIVGTSDASASDATGQGEDAVEGELNIAMTGADLTPQQCTQALNSIEQALDTVELTTTVPPGQHVAIGGISPEGIPYSKVTTTTLHGRLMVQAQEFTGRPCTSLPFGGPYVASSRDRAWGVEISIVEVLVFTQSNGQVAGRTSTIQGQVNMTLAVPASSDAGWRLATIDPPISDQVAAGFCGAGVQVLSDAYSRAYPNRNWSMSVSADHGLEGCRIEMDADDASGNSNGFSSHMNYLWSFGVLLAADSAAHQALPLLPLASASELNAVPPNP